MLSLGAPPSAQAVSWSCALWCSLTFARHVCVPILKDDWERVPVPIDVQALCRQRGHAGKIIRITNFCGNLCVALDPASKVQNKFSAWVAAVLLLHQSCKPRYTGRGQSMYLKGNSSAWWGITELLEGFHLSVRDIYNLHNLFLKNNSVSEIIPDPTAQSPLSCHNPSLSSQGSQLLAGTGSLCWFLVRKWGLSLWLWSGFQNPDAGSNNQKFGWAVQGGTKPSWMHGKSSVSHQNSKHSQRSVSHMYKSEELQYITQPLSFDSHRTIK